METPLHHHPNDGGYYPDCKRCQMNTAAPALAEALRRALAFMLTRVPKEAKGYANPCSKSAGAWLDGPVFGPEIENANK